ncbi:efflux RND transporter periplasmic adaptor subunit [Phragmitibacter flavus]|uniref:Efflux RND transporter periplasmic adaptor subunit n=1 Tax=Phragmitibacter flavus TaxID=2576071 RepID=A0A5R8KFU9_9BACT|nr:efflux RND transporter periplasmic adaptor subunit [Phragmitibacter flavus]TLD70835.1 efflux RND transporter periplasmic adaptor subunit [Phragmitibacter flavus]
MKIPILPILAVGCLIAAVHTVISSQPQRSSTSPPKMPPRSLYEKTIAAMGLVEPSSEMIFIGSHRSGVVQEVLVTTGQKVRAGDALIRLDTRELEATLKVDRAQWLEARSQLRVAQSQCMQSRRSFEYAQKLAGTRAISEEEVTDRKTALETALARVEAAESSIALAEARIQLTETEIKKSTLHAPIDATVLQLKIRAGEAVSATPAATPWLTLGQTDTLHLRADVDEHEAWRVRPDAEATAQVRGNPELQAALEFVRFEPLVIPKKSLSGDATERVDTRVLQVIYRVKKGDAPALYAGQQMDVFILAGGSTP